MLEALSGSVQASALDLSQNGIATLEFQDQHRRLHHVSTLLVGRLGDLWEWIVLNHQQISLGAPEHFEDKRSLCSLFDRIFIPFIPKSWGSRVLFFCCGFPCQKKHGPRLTSKSKMSLTSHFATYRTKIAQYPIKNKHEIILAILSLQAWRDMKSIAVVPFWILAHF